MKRRKKLKLKKQKKPSLVQVKCPCCQDFANKNDLTKTLNLGLFNQLSIPGDDTLVDEFITSLKKYSLYQWACDNCLKEGKAILAKPEKQNYSSWGYPNLAYFDKTCTCRNCQSKFIFSGKEQQYWYEELQFYIDSLAVHCIPCRKQIQAKKNLNTRLSGLLKNGDPKDAKVLEEIALLYKEMDKTEKWKEYMTKSKKRKTG